MAIPTVAYKVGQTAWQHRPRISISSQVTASLLAIGAAAGVFLGIKAVVNNFKQGIREQQALIDGNPAAFATQLKLAFENDNYFGWGTDEDTLYQVLETIPSKAAMLQVQRAYRDLYGRNLSADLKNELTTQEFAKALA
ncbi:MAG: hypothetical protein WBA74_07410, partial [Cyclobacteriaceae bacterium]